MKYINTTKVPIKPDNMGITLMHEHVFNLYPYYMEKENTEFVIQQIERLKKYNVNTIVDLTPYAKIGAYKKLLQQCDINLICATGFFLDKTVPTSYKRASLDELVEKISKKIECGIGDNKYKPGVLKIAANGEKLNERQLMFFEVVAILHKKYKIPIATHSPRGALNHLKTLANFGADPKHIYLSHVENEITINNFDQCITQIKQIVEFGSNIVITNFGTNERGTRYKSSIKLMSYLKENDFIKQTLISADSNWRWKGNKLKLRDSQYIGAEKTYAYVFEYIIPSLIKIGFKDEDIRYMLIDNPKRIFEF